MRRFWSIAALLAAPWLLLVLLEGGLRLAGVGEAARTPFMPVPEHDDYLVLNPEYVRRYFTGYVPGVAYTPFRADKPPDAFRVFVMGESSVAGFPYSFYNGFPTRLQERLESVLPGRPVEVINLGITAVSSFSLWDLKDAVLKQRPDAVVIYAGHNEYYGSFGAGSSQFSLGNRIWLKRLVLSLKDLALYSAMERAIGGLLKTPSGPNRTLMAAAVREAGIEQGGPVYEAGVEQFEANLRDAIKTFRREDIPVYLGTLTSNLKDQPPLGEDAAAEAAFRQGSALLRAGDATGARAHLLEAKEKDPIRFRAPEAMNEVIHSFDREEGVMLVDVQEWIRQQSAGGVEGDALFDDHLHPSYTGYDLIAGAFFQAMRAHPSLQDSPHQALPSAPAVDPIDAAHAELQIARLKAGYPFNKSISPAEEQALFERILGERLRSGRYADSLAVLCAAGRMVMPRALLEGAQLARSRADTLAALRMLRAALYWQPFDERLTNLTVDFAISNPAFSVAVEPIVLFGAGRTGAVRHLNALAAIRLRQRRLPEARALLQAVEAREPTSEIMLYNTARLLALMGDTTGVRRYAQRYRRVAGARQGFR